jgi:hypothetical protein
MWTHFPGLAVLVKVKIPQPMLQSIDVNTLRRLSAKIKDRKTERGGLGPENHRGPQTSSGIGWMVEDTFIDSFKLS